MALQTKIGTFASPGATGNQTITFGFEPKGIIFWTSGAVTNGAFSDHVVYGLGFVGKPTDETNRRFYSEAGCTINGAAIAANVAFYTRGFYPFQLVNQLGMTHRASDITINSDGFTLNWTTVGAARQINYMAIGGDDIYAGIRYLENDSAAGETRTYEGFGFRPKVNFTMTLLDIPANAMQTTFGFGETISRNPLLGLGTRNISETRVAENFHYGYGQVFGGVGIPDSGTAYTTPDGFVIYFPAGVSYYDMVVLSFGGDIISKFVAFSKSTTTGVTTQTVNMGWKPDLLMLLSIMDPDIPTSHTTVLHQTANRWSMGFVNATEQAVATHSDISVVSPTNTYNHNAINRTFVKHDNTTRTIESYATPAFVSGGFRMDYGANDAVNSAIFALALAYNHKSISGRTSGTSRANLSEIKSFIEIRGKAVGTSRVTAWVGTAHILDPDRVEGTSSATLMLSGTTEFEGEARGTSRAEATLSQAAELTGIVLGTSRAHALNLRRNVFLDARMTGTSLASATLATAVELGPIRIVGYSDADAYLILELPKVYPTPVHHAPGTINLHRNPSVEKDLLDWAAFGSATIERTPAEQWHGNASAMVTIPTDAIGSGFVAEGVKGLGLAAREWSIYGQIELMGPATGIRACMRGYYSDETTSDGDSIDLELGPGWHPFPVPAFLTDPEKIFIGADLVVERFALGPEIVLYADGVQIEEGQLSSFAYGGYGPPYYSWGGPTDASVSVRQPQPYVIGGIGDGGGVIEITGKIYRANYDNDHLEDLTDHLIDAKVTMDSERDYTWVLDATMTRRGWDRLRPELDWLAPHMTVRYPNGVVREGQLGLYMVMDSPSEHTEWTETIDIQAFDALWLLDRQMFPADVVAPINFNKIHFSRLILDGAVLTEGKSPPRRFSLPQDPDTFKGNREWDRETTRLDMVNEVVRAAGMHSLWSTREGIITTKPRGAVRLLNQNPVRMWHANVPANLDLRHEVRFNPLLPPEIIGKVKKTPKSLDMVNEILLISDAPEGLRAIARRRIANIRNKRDRLNNQDTVNRDLTPAQRRARRRRRIREIGIPYIDDNAKAAQVARALLDKWSTKDEVVDFSCVPDPGKEFTNECIYLGIWDGYGQEVAVGKYLVHKITYGFTPRDGDMRVIAGRVQHSEDIFE